MTAIIGEDCSQTIDDRSSNFTTNICNTIRKISVDDRIAYRLLRLFEELHRTGTAVVVATHNDALVRRFSHPALVLADNMLHTPVDKERDSMA